MRPVGDGRPLRQPAAPLPSSPFNKKKQNKSILPSSRLRGHRHWQSPVTIVHHEGDGRSRLLARVPLTWMPPEPGRRCVSITGDDARFCPAPAHRVPAPSDSSPRRFLPPTVDRPRLPAATVRESVTVEEPRRASCPADWGGPTPPSGSVSTAHGRTPWPGMSARGVPPAVVLLPRARPRAELPGGAGRDRVRGPRALFTAVVGELDSTSRPAARVVPAEQDGARRCGGVVVRADVRRGSAC